MTGKTMRGIDVRYFEGDPTFIRVLGFPDADGIDVTGLRESIDALEFGSKTIRLTRVFPHKDPYVAKVSSTTIRDVLAYRLFDADAATGLSKSSHRRVALRVGTSPENVHDADEILTAHGWLTHHGVGGDYKRLIPSGGDPVIEHVVRVVGWEFTDVYVKTP
ncbi:hypothetical protein [Isoptericola sp. NPDC019482]|uniref:hypothetical protein n=1 Tax=Isoptericola sp. NPDC019482 TaxID=3154688 RepID=UPI00348CA62E